MCENPRKRAAKALLKIIAAAKELVCAEQTILKERGENSPTIYSEDEGGADAA